MKFKDKRAFYPTRDEAERAKDKGKIISVYLNEEEWTKLQEQMRTLRQPKDSTTFKQVWKLGTNLLDDPKTGLAIRTVLGNIVKNERMGITTYEPEKPANLTEKNEEISQNRN